MSIIDRQKPREGSAYATYAHQRKPENNRPLKVIFWFVCLCFAVGVHWWLFNSFLT